MGKVVNPATYHSSESLPIMTSFNRDDLVFLADGRQASYICQVDGGSHVVSILFDYGHMDDYEDSYRVRESNKTEIVKEVFSEPPVEKYAKEYDQVIRVKEKTLEELRNKVEELRREEAELTTNLKLIKQNSYKYPDIQRTLDFLEDKITHVVFKRYSYEGYSIFPFEDVIDASKQSPSYREEGVKLLCLFGYRKDGSKITTKWRINQYYDGSGSWTEIHPCKSEQEAREKLLELFTGELEAWRAGFASGSIESTLKGNPWITPPEDWLAYLNEKEGKAKEERISKLVKELSELGVQVPGRSLGG